MTFPYPDSDAPHEPDEFDEHPIVTVSNETSEAIADLYRPREDYFHFPWSALDNVVGGMPGGTVCYVAGFSSQGKTTFLTSLTDTLFETTEKRIYYAGLESQPKELRKHWACKRLGIDAGDVLTGKFLEWQNWKEIREAVEAEVASQNRGAKFERVRFCPTPYVDGQKLRRMASAAADFGADILIIDHVDHIRANAKSAYEHSVEINQAILDAAHQHGFIMMPSTQLNNEVAKTNRLALHLPPQPHYVKYGGHKREVAAWMIGVYRPLKLAGVEPEVLKAVNAGLRPQYDAVEPGMMAAVMMKHRFYGNREWQKTYLGVEYGKVVDLPERDQYQPMRGGSYEIG